MKNNTHIKAYIWSGLLILTRIIVNIINESKIPINAVNGSILIILIKIIVTIFTIFFLINFVKYILYKFIKKQD